MPERERRSPVVSSVPFPELQHFIHPLDAAHAFAFIVEQVELAVVLRGGEIGLVEWDALRVQELLASETAIGFADIAIDLKCLRPFVGTIVLDIAPLPVVMEWAPDAG